MTSQSESQKDGTSGAVASSPVPDAAVTSPTLPGLASPGDQSALSAEGQARGLDVSVYEPVLAPPVAAVSPTRAQRLRAFWMQRRQALQARRIQQRGMAAAAAAKAIPKKGAPAGGNVERSQSGSGSRIAGFVIAVGLGGWSAFLLGPEVLRQWDQWRHERAVEAKLREHVAELPPPPPPLPAHDPAIGKLGTDSSLSKEPLGLVLVAAQPGRTPLEGTAQLGVDVRNPQTYGAGALLENGARLVEIHTDAVVLERGTQRYRLRLRENVAQIERAQLPPGQSGFESRAQTAERNVRRNLAMVGGVSGSSTTPAPTTSFDHHAEVVRTYAEVQNGRVTALIVGQGTTGAGLARLGLRHGDRITSVDGQPVWGETQWNSVMDALSAGSSVTVSVQRGESVEDVTLTPSALQPPTPPPMPTQGAGAPPGMS